jgi:hypothetical protein
MAQRTTYNLNAECIKVVSRSDVFGTKILEFSISLFEIRKIRIENFL